MPRNKIKVFEETFQSGMFPQKIGPNCSFNAASKGSTQTRSRGVRVL